MDTEERRTLTVVYATKALKQLDKIWDWNEEHYTSCAVSTCVSSTNAVIV